MNKMVEGCQNCEGFFGCYYNDFKRCPKIEIATEGMGIPCKPVDNSWMDKVPFGVYMGLKHIMAKVSNK